MLFYSGWFSMRKTEAEIVGRSAGGYHVKVRYRCILGYMREKWTTSDELVEIDQSLAEIAELERLARR